MKKTVILAMTGAVLLAGASCTQENIFGETADNGLCVTLDCGEIGTRTSVSAEGVGNENLIQTVDYFIFAGNGEQGDFLHKGRREANVSSNFTFYIDGSYVENGSYTIYTIVNYPGSVADLGSESDKKTLEYLEGLVLDETQVPSFSAVGSGSVTPAAEADLKLVMTGKNTVTINKQQGQQKVGETTIPLKRLAAKVTLDFFIKDRVQRTSGSVTEIWTPLTDGDQIRVYLCNGAGRTMVGGVSADAPVPFDYGLFDYEPNLDNTSILGKADYNTAFTSAAFYSYPETWEQGGREEPYLKLIVPWKLTRISGGTTTESQKEFYYKVMLPTEEFASNHWYKLCLDVTQLGSATDDDAVNLLCDYQIVPWGDRQETDNALAQAFYLDVNGGNLVIDLYGDDLDIPFFASGEVVILKESSYHVWWTDYRTNKEKDLPNNKDKDGNELGSEDAVPAVTQTASRNWVSVSSNGDYITIRHKLDKNYSGSSYDVSPYQFIFRVHLVAAGESDKWDKQVTVNQYPPLYITSESNFYRPNSSLANMYINGWSFYKTGYSANANYVYFDDLYSSYDRTTNDITSSMAEHYIGTISNITTAGNGSGTNSNPFIYEVTTTIINLPVELPNGETVNAVIGDPRAAELDFDFNFKDPGNGGNDLKYSYYPAGSNTQNVIAPKFKIASSYGKSMAITYEGAKRRCAVYQEAGYPAGRWRLPTLAEITYLTKLSDDGKIPSLFLSQTGTTTSSPIYSYSTGYWTGGKIARILNNSYAIDKEVYIGHQPAMSYPATDAEPTLTTDKYLIAARCVYDSWYWGSGYYSNDGVTYDRENPQWLGIKTR